MVPVDVEVLSQAFILKTMNKEWTDMIMLQLITTNRSFQRRLPISSALMSLPMTEAVKELMMMDQLLVIS